MNNEARSAYNADGHLLVVDGNPRGDGVTPPFFVFDVYLQKILSGPFDTLVGATAALSEAIQQDL